jgi:hypothetical protein
MLNKIAPMFVKIGSLFVSILSTGIVVMLLWNWLMPIIFELPKINYLEGMGIYLLFGMIKDGIKFNVELLDGDKK